MIIKLNKLMNKARKDESGFTLIELLVVLIIFGVIAAIVVPKFFTSIDKSKYDAEAANKALIQNAVDRYYIEKDAYPADVDALVTYGYLKTAPKKADGLTSFSIDSTTGVVS